MEDEEDRAWPEFSFGSENDSERIFRLNTKFVKFDVKIP